MDDSTALSRALLGSPAATYTSITTYTRRLDPLGNTIDTAVEVITIHHVRPPLNDHQDTVPEANHGSTMYLI
jgi:hypothetical protein